MVYPVSYAFRLPPGDFLPGSAIKKQSIFLSLLFLGVVIPCVECSRGFLGILPMRHQDLFAKGTSAAPPWTSQDSRDVYANEVPSVVHFSVLLGSFSPQ